MDIDNLARYFLAFVFCATTDHCQGALVKDNRKRDAKAFLINWDMDHSFFDVEKEFKKDKRHRRRVFYQQPGLARFVELNTSVICGQQTLFTRLLNEDPAYKAYVIRLTMDLLNHRITQAFLTERLDHYEKIITNFGDQYRDHLEKLRQFCRERPDFIRHEMQALFDLGAIHACRINGPADVSYDIDGYPEKPGYKGWYFEGMPIEIEVTGQQRQRFSHWLVNNRKITGHPLSLSVNAHMIIEPVFKESLVN